MIKNKKRKVVSLIIVFIILCGLSIRFVPVIQKGYAWMRLQIVFHYKCETDDFKTRFYIFPEDPEPYPTYCLECTPKDDSKSEIIIFSYQIYKGIEY